MSCGFTTRRWPSSCILITAGCGGPGEANPIRTETTSATNRRISFRYIFILEPITERLCGDGERKVEESHQGTLGFFYFRERVFCVGVRRLAHWFRRQAF